MAIIANNLNEAEAKEQAKTSLMNRIAEHGGKTTFEDFWGARGFAYKIENEKWGYYFVCQFEIEPGEIAKIERELNIDGKIVRFLFTAVDAKMPAPVPYAEYQKKAEEAKKALADAEAAAAEEKVAAKSAAATPKKEEKKDEVDKKLDQILDDASSDL